MVEKDAVLAGEALLKANALMVDALCLLDQCHHEAAAYLDHAIVKLGVRPDGEGMPPDGYLS